MRSMLLMAVAGILFVAVESHAAVENFVRDGTYHVGEDDSKKSCIRKNIAELQRKVIMEIGVHVQGRTEVRNFELTLDTIAATFAGEMSTKILAEKWDGLSCYVKASIAADPEQIRQSLHKLIHNKDDNSTSKEVETTKNLSGKMLAVINDKHMHVDKIRDNIMSLIQKGANVNYRDPGGKTALMYAAEQGLEDIVALLISNGASLNNLEDNWSALHYGVANGHKEIVLLLINKGARVNVTNNEGKTALDMAVSLQKKDMIRILFMSGADVNAKLSSGVLPILWAIENYWEIVWLLVEKGADVKGRDSYGWTPLHYAALRTKNLRPIERKGMIALFVEKGADINAKDNSGQAIIIRAIAEKVQDGVNTYRGTSGGGFDSKGRYQAGTPYYYTTPRMVHHDDEIVSLLIENGADINVGTAEGDTPLMVAVEQYRSKIAALLIKKGANVNARNKARQTPLIKAVSLNKGWGRKEIVQLLIDNGADVNVKDNRGMTPLSIIIKGKSCWWPFGKDEIEGMLEAAGATTVESLGRQ